MEKGFIVNTPFTEIAFLFHGQTHKRFVLQILSLLFLFSKCFVQECGLLWDIMDFYEALSASSKGALRGVLLLDLHRD